MAGWTSRLRVVSGCIAVVLALTYGLLTACSAAKSEVLVRDSVDAYSWDELALIADEIAKADDDRAALSIAQRYHLVNSEGKLDATQSKEVQLADGTVVHVLIAGFRQDETASGSMVGITFVFGDAVCLREMNGNAGEDDLSEYGFIEPFGGWAASEMRSWLNGEFLDALPADLRAVMATATKTSCVVTQDMADGSTSATNSTNEQTSDMLWLPSLAEVANLDVELEFGDDFAELERALRCEGASYQLFSDAMAVLGSAEGVRVRALAGDDNGKPCAWWLRSVGKTSFIDVRADGSFTRVEDAETIAARPQGVVPCFAL